jgi:molybdate transport repressor ModE-like protein
MNQRAFDLAQLRTFVAVAEAGSVSAGAERVFLSQSSASEQLKKLEERAGQPLFLRGKQGVTATPAGAKLLDHARRILAMSEAASKICKAARSTANCASRSPTTTGRTTSRAC